MSMIISFPRFIILTSSLILFAIALLSQNALARSQHTETVRIRIKIFDEALLVFKNNVGRFPTTEEGLEALIVQPKGVSRWKGPYLNYPTIPPDSWGIPFIYRCPAEDTNKEYDLYSFGPNKIDEHGLGDDIVSRRK